MFFAGGITPNVKGIKDLAKKKSIINISVLLSRRRLILFMRRSLYRQLEDSLEIWSSKVTAVSTPTPKSFTTAKGHNLGGWVGQSGILEQTAHFF